MARSSVSPAHSASAPRPACTSLIGEIMFYAFGFEEGRVLARKMVPLVARVASSAPAHTCVRLRRCMARVLLHSVCLSMRALRTEEVPESTPHYYYTVYSYGHYYLHRRLLWHRGPVGSLLGVAISGT